MRCTPEHALELLERWKADGSWVFAVARFGEGDEHRFWARVRGADKNEIWLAGESAMVSLRPDSKACKYEELSTLPPEIAQHLGSFDRCLSVQCDEFSATLVALKPDADKAWRSAISERQQKMTTLRPDNPPQHSKPKLLRH